MLGGRMGRKGENLRKTDRKGKKGIALYLARGHVVAVGEGEGKSYRGRQRRVAKCGREGGSVVSGKRRDRIVKRMQGGMRWE